MLSQYRSPLRSYMLEFIEAQRSVLRKTYWTNDVIDRYLTFCKSGKLFRGSLLLATYKMLGQSDLDKVMPGAASLELMQASLLIHDDILDRDELRRGKPSFFKQYKDVARELKYADADHMGLSLALCAGDIGFFWGFELIAKLDVPATQKARILEFFAREYSTVGLGEMLDLHQTAVPKAVTEKDILTLYRYKTARYTFTLPLVLAAMAAGASEATIQLLDELGEVIGVMFQIKDDEIGLFGSEAETGKSVLSDVREGKKTLYYHYLFQLASTTEQTRMRKIFGNPDITLVELEEVRRVVKKSGTKKLVDSYYEKYVKQANKLLVELPISSEAKKIFSNFIQENILRSA